jgi:hypothetical protein
MECLDLTNLTLDEFEQLIPSFEEAFQARMTHWRLDGNPVPHQNFQAGPESLLQMCTDVV